MFPAVVLVVVQFSMLRFSRKFRFRSVCFIRSVPPAFVCFNCLETVVGLRLCCGGFAIFHSPCSHDDDLKSICLTHTCDRFVFTSSIYVVLLRRCFRYHVSNFPFIYPKSLGTPFVLLYFLVIFALSTSSRRASQTIVSL